VENFCRTALGLLTKKNKTFSDKILLMQSVEEGDRKKCGIANEFNIPSNILLSIEG
jgi:hypothetical protein